MYKGLIADRQKKMLLPMFRCINDHPQASPATSANIAG